jgi:hypothetical protein
MADAQDNQLALDEHNKYIYYQVIDLPGISADSLHKNAEGFVKMNYSKNGKINTDNNSESINVKDKFSTQSAGALVKRDNGEMSYTLNIQCKDGKYRYWLTDFVFTPYQRDRYGAFTTVNAVSTPLENAKAKLSKTELSSYLDQTTLFCKQLGEKLKQYMVEGHPQIKTTKQPPKIVTDKW